MKAITNYIAAIIIDIEYTMLEKLISRAIRKLKVAIAPLVLASAMAVTPRAQAGMEWLGWYNTGDPNAVVGEVNIINDNNGATYDSYQVKLEDLANQIWSNNPSLHGSYPAPSNLVANGLFSYSIAPKPTSEVANGWLSEINTNGAIRLYNEGGIPGLDFDTWYATQQNSSQDMQRGTLNVKKTFLDLDGDGWTTNELTIGNDTNETVVGGVGYMDAVNIFTNNIPRIKVILPTRDVIASAGANGTIEPNGTVKVPYNSSTTFVANATQPGYRLQSVTKDGSVIFTNSTKDNTIVTGIIPYGPVTNNGSVAATFEPKTYSVTLNSTHPWFSTNVIGNPTINGESKTNGTYDYGSSVNVEVDKNIIDTNNSGRRLTVDSINVIE